MARMLASCKEPHGPGLQRNRLGLSQDECPGHLTPLRRVATTALARRSSVVAFGGVGRLGHAARDTDGLANLLLDLDRHGGIFLEELARIVLALADLLALVGVPGAGFLDDAVVHAHLDDLALARDALVVEDVEVGGNPAPGTP